MTFKKATNWFQINLVTQCIPQQNCFMCAHYFMKKITNKRQWYFLTTTGQTIGILLINKDTSLITYNTLLIPKQEI